MSGARSMVLAVTGLSLLCASVFVLLGLGAFLGASGFALLILNEAIERGTRRG